MSSEAIVVRARNLTKIYRLFDHPGDRVKQFMTLGLKRYHREFTALQDVSFDIRRGETVGIIGRNGAGKSTLLQLICGILKPTSGTVEVCGRVSALLELGAGFNPEFTGRENVYFQGALMGLTRQQMEARFDEIATFADIGEFIDQPVRTYSSGMFVRLAFAVAVHVDPDILVVDEALAVGDAAFQEKCFRKMSQLRDMGAVILVVSHSMEQIALFCSAALLLDHGAMVIQGKVTDVLNAYTAQLHGYQEGERVADPPLSAHDAEDPLASHPLYNEGEKRWGDGMVEIRDVEIVQKDRLNPARWLPGERVTVRFAALCHAAVRKPICGLTIRRAADGAIMLLVNSRDIPGTIPVSTEVPPGLLRGRFDFHPYLEAGDYVLSLGIVSDLGQAVLPHDRRYDVIRFAVAHPRLPDGRIDMHPTFEWLDP